MARRIKGKERVYLAGPVRKQLDEEPFREKIAHTDCLDAGNADTGKASAQQRAHFRDAKAAFRFHRLDLASSPVFPISQ